MPGSFHAARSVAKQPPQRPHVYSRGRHSERLAGVFSADPVEVLSVMAYLGTKFRGLSDPAGHAWGKSETSWTRGTSYAGLLTSTA